MKILVVYYSRYGHVYQMAQSVLQGAAAVAGAEAVLRRVAEFPEDIPAIEKNEHSRAVWEKQKDIPECTLDDLKNADAIIWGSPTRYGNMIAQMKKLIDSTAGLWLAGALEGKPAGVFTSTATTHGGQETTLLSMMIPLLHLGMIIVGVPYSTEGMLHTEGRGGTPYGPTVVAGPRNEIAPPQADLKLAWTLGRRVAGITARLVLPQT